MQGEQCGVAPSADETPRVVVWHTCAGKERNAFRDRGGGKLALPRLLRLTPEDRLVTGGRPFRNGRFTWITEAGSTERWIVASCGRHTVIWNFRRCGTSPPHPLPILLLYSRAHTAPGNRAHAGACITVWPRPASIHRCALPLTTATSRRVKGAVSSSTSYGGLPTVMDYVLSAKDEDVVDSNFMHDRYAPTSGGARGDALVVATPHKVFTLAGED